MFRNPSLGKSISIVAILGAGITAGAQGRHLETTGVSELICTPSYSETWAYDSTAPCKWVEVMPAFNGDLMAYLAANRHYPDSSLARAEEGRVIVQFIVGKTGRIRDPKVVRSSTFRVLDQEGMRIIRTMMDTPMWTPGRQNGKNVDVLFTLPITFKID